MGIWEHGDMESWGYGDVGLWGHGDMGIWGRGPMGSRGLWGRGVRVGHAGVPSPPTPPVEVKPEGPHPHLRGGASPQATPPAAPDPKPIPDPEEKEKEEEEEEEEEEEGGGSRDPPEALSLWLSDMEELMGRQRPPAADLKVAKAQLDEQKVGAAPRRGGALSPGRTPTAPRPPQLLRRLLEERRPRVERCLRQRSGGGGEALRRRWGRLREEADERYERGAARRGAADAVTRGHRRGGGGRRGDRPGEQPVRIPLPFTPSLTPSLTPLLTPLLTPIPDPHP